MPSSRHTSRPDGRAAGWGLPQLDPVLDAAAAVPGALVQVAAWSPSGPLLDAWRAGPGPAADGDTPVPVYSVGKGVLTAAALAAVAQGRFGLDRPIADAWPAFAAAGKERITLRDVLRHCSGCAAMPGDGRMPDPADWSAMTGAVAAMVPARPPGQLRRYQALTMSWLVGGLLERVLGTPFPAMPVPMPGVWWGAPGPVLRRIRPIVATGPTPVPGPDTEPDPERRLAIPASLHPLETALVSQRMLAACIPASCTVATARALARGYAALLPGAGPGALPADLLAEAVADAPLPGEARGGWGLGFQRLGPDEDPGAAFGHDGFGGSIAWADRRRGVGVALVTSHIGLGPLRERLLDVLRGVG
ncbi:MAG: hypothetical protein RLZZ127_607 [Planctomycetota bacterium]|jgi:CubicO group peptidase (beta-lactamase class C family)